MLQLLYFVANMVREFEWREAPGHEVEFGEKSEFTEWQRTPENLGVANTTKNKGIMTKCIIYSIVLKKVTIEAISLILLQTIFQPTMLSKPMFLKAHFVM
jgi:hypothetical protein